MHGIDISHVFEGTAKWQSAVVLGGKIYAVPYHAYLWQLVDWLMWTVLGYLEDIESTFIRFHLIKKCGGWYFGSFLLTLGVYATYINVSYCMLCHWLINPTASCCESNQRPSPNLPKTIPFRFVSCGENLKKRMSSWYFHEYVTCPLPGVSMI